LSDQASSKVFTGALPSGGVKTVVQKLRPVRIMQRRTMMMEAKEVKRKNLRRRRKTRRKRGMKLKMPC